MQSPAHLETLYLQARAGDKGARVAMNDIKRKMRAGDVQSNRDFDALSVIHWRNRSASEWATAEHLYDRMARNEPNVWKWADEVRQRAHAGHQPAVRMYAMLRATHMQRTTKTPETAGYNMRMRRVGFAVGATQDEWAYLIQLMQQALVSVPGIPLDDFITASAAPQQAAPAPAAIGPAKPSLVSSALQAVAAKAAAPAPTLGKRKATTVQRTPECQTYYDLSVKLGTSDPKRLAQIPAMAAVLQAAMEKCQRSQPLTDACKAYENAKKAGQKQVILDALAAKCRAQRGY